MAEPFKNYLREIATPHAPLTASFVSSAVCPCGKRKIEFIDTSLEGFFIEVLSSGVKTYYQRYVDAQRRQRQVRIGRVGIVHLDDAKRKALAIKAAVSLGKDPRTISSEPFRGPTLYQFIENYYLPHIKTSKRSWKDDERLLRNYIIPKIGHMYMAEVAPFDILKLVNDMKNKGLANGTCNRPVILLRYAFNLAIKWGLESIESNPAKNVKLLEENKRQRFLTDEETSRLVNVLHTHPDRKASQAIELLLLTGARRNEILHARWDCVDREKRTLLVPMSKNGKPRLIALSDAAVDLIESIDSKGKSQWLFPSVTKEGPINGFHAKWAAIRKIAGLDDFRIHDLRHSYASFLVNSGVGLYVVQQLLGHSQPRTTQRYAHLQRGTLTEAANLAAGAVAKAAY